MNIEKIREDFPILGRKIGEKPLIYLDNAATTQKPIQVIDKIVEYYSKYNANIHRGVHSLSQEATDLYENARKKLQKFINAKKSHEIIFTSGTTEGINLVASGLASILKKDEEIWVLTTEHHSNIVPWQLVSEKTKAKVCAIPVDNQGVIDWQKFEKCFSEKMKVISVQHISNALGNIHDVEKIIKKAKEFGVITIVDGAQSAPHLRLDVQALDCDFLVFSAHKMYAPTGVGVLYGKENWLEKLPPYKGGGEMIKQVTFERSTYADLPYKFEAGTPNICGGIAFGEAIDYIEKLGIDFIAQHENELLKYCFNQLSEIQGVMIYGSQNLKERASLISFNVEMAHPYDIGTILDKMGIAVRTGHHCSQTTMDFLKVSGTIRASFAVYNTFQEIDSFIEALKKAQRMFV